METLFSTNFKIEWEANRNTDVFLSADEDLINPFTGSVIGKLYASERVPVYTQKILLIAESALELLTFWGAAKLPYQHIGIHIKDLQTVIDAPEGTPGVSFRQDEYFTMELKLSDEDLFMSTPHELFHLIQFSYNNTKATEKGFALALYEGSAIFISDLIVGSNKTTLLSGNQSIHYDNHTLYNASVFELPGPHYFSGFLSSVYKYLNISNREKIGRDLIKLFELYKVGGAYEQFEISGFKKFISELPWFTNFDTQSHYSNDSEEYCSKNTLLLNYIAQLPFSQIGNQELHMELKPGTLSYFDLTSANNEMEATITSSSKVNLVYLEKKKIVFIKNTDKITFNTNFNLDKKIFILTNYEPATIVVQRTYLTAKSDIQITNWNCTKASNIELNPVGFTWTFLSPDIEINNKTGGAILKGEDNAVKVRIRNLGAAKAANVKVEFFYQKASPFPNSKNWKPIKNKNGKIQVLNGLTVDVNEEKWLRSISWCPESDDEIYNEFNWYTIKVKISAENDSPSSNKTALHNIAIINSRQLSIRDHLSLNVNYIKEYGLGKLKVAHRSTSFKLKIENPIESVLSRAKDLTQLNSNFLPIPNGSKKINLNFNHASNQLQDWVLANDAFTHAENYFFPIEDNDTLPPSIKKENLITVYHSIDGRLVGGLSLYII